MRLSPPLTILAILAASLAGAAWFAPPMEASSQAVVVLPAATYQKLVLWAKEHTDLEGRPSSVAKAIETLADQMGEGR
jgi:hypothetical protein